MRFPWTDTPEETACNLAFGQLHQALMRWLTVDGRIHAETMMAAIGALAGFAAQRTLLAHMATDTAIRREMRLVTTASGTNYIFGEPLNQMFLTNDAAEGQRRLWPLAAGGALAAGLRVEELPELTGMFAHVSQSIGSDREGLPSTDKQPHMTPRDILQRTWPFAKSCLSGALPGMPAELGAPPIASWPAITAQIAARMIRDAATVLDPKTALTILMESAIFASKLDPASVDATEPALGGGASRPGSPERS